MLATLVVESSIVAVDGRAFYLVKDVIWLLVRLLLIVEIICQQIRMLRRPYCPYSAN